MRAAWWCALLLLLASGCLSHDGPASASVAGADADREGRAASEVAGPSGGPATETTQTHSGTIVARVPCGCSDDVYLGDSSSFCFALPTNVTLLRGVFAFSPYQQAGLEFHGPDFYKNSWDAAPADLVRQSPITLEVDSPESGDWFVYGGPGIEGGAMDWTLDLTMVTNGAPSADAVATFETVDMAC